MHKTTRLKMRTRRLVASVLALTVLLTTPFAAPSQSAKKSTKTKAATQK